MWEASRWRQGSGGVQRHRGSQTLLCGQWRGGCRVHLSVGNRSGYRGNRSYRSGSVRKKLGYRSLTEPSKP
jgi:hypothetical protein